MTYNTYTGGWLWRYDSYETLPIERLYLKDRPKVVVWILRFVGIMCFISAIVTVADKWVPVRLLTPLFGVRGWLL